MWELLHKYRVVEEVLKSFIQVKVAIQQYQKYSTTGKSPHSQSYFCEVQYNHQ